MDRSMKIVTFVVSCVALGILLFFGIRNNTFNGGSTSQEMPRDPDLPSENSLGQSGVVLHCLSSPSPDILYSFSGKNLGNIQGEIPRHPYSFGINVDVEYNQSSYLDPYKASMAYGSAFIHDTSRIVVQVRPNYRTDRHPTGDYLARLDESGKLQKLILPDISPSDNYHYYAHEGWTKDGDVLITQTIPNGVSRGLWLYHWDTRRVENLVPETISINDFGISPDGKLLIISFNEIRDRVQGLTSVKVLNLENIDYSGEMTCPNKGWIQYAAWYISDPEWIRLAEELEVLRKSINPIKVTVGEENTEKKIHYFEVVDDTPNTLTLRVHPDVDFESLGRENFEHCILSASAGGFEEGRAPSCSNLNQPFDSFEQGTEPKLIPFVKNNALRTIKIGDETKDIGFDPYHDMGLFRIGCASCTSNIWINNFLTKDPITGTSIKREHYGISVY